MKLCILVNNFRPPWDEGGKNNMREILIRMQRDHQIFVIGIGEKELVDDSEGYSFYQFRSPFYTTRFVRLFYVIGYLRMILRARKLLKQEQPDLLFSYFETASTGIFAYLVKWWSGCPAPVVHTVWSDWYEFTPAPLGIWITEHLPHWVMNNRWATWISLRFMDHILATSHHLVERVRSLGFRNVTFTPTGVAVERYQPNPDLRRRYDEKFIIGYLGHLSHAKGVSLLLDAVLPILEELDARLLLATTLGAEEDSLVANLEHSRVTCFHLVDPNEFFNSCDLSVLPRRRSSSTVSYPNVLLESMACGVPVLTSELPAIKEVISEGENGFLFEPNSMEDLRAKICFLANNLEKVRNAGTRARTFVVEQMNWDLQARRIVEAVDSIEKVSCHDKNMKP